MRRRFFGDLRSRATRLQTRNRNHTFSSGRGPVCCIGGMFSSTPYGTVMVQLLSWLPCRRPFAPQRAPSAEHRLA